MSTEPRRKQGETAPSGDRPATPRLELARERLEYEGSHFRKPSRQHRPYIRDSNESPFHDKGNGQVVQRKPTNDSLNRPMTFHSVEGKSSSEWYSPLDPNPERTKLLQSIVGRQPYVDISTGRYVPAHVDLAEEALIYEARCAGALANQLLQYAADAEVRVLKQQIPGNIETLDKHEDLLVPAYLPWSPEQLAAFEYDDIDVFIKGWLVKGHPWSSVEYITREYFGRPIELAREKLRQKTWEAKLRRETALRHPLHKLDYDSKLEKECEKFKAALNCCPSSVYSSGDTAVEAREKRNKFQAERVEAFVYASHGNEADLTREHSSLSTVEASSKNFDVPLASHDTPKSHVGAASEQDWSNTGLEDDGPFDPDQPVQSIEDRAINASDKWKPVYIRRLTPLGPEKTAQIVPIDEMVSFGYDFLKNVFGDGAYQWNEGGTFIIPKKVKSLFQCRLFYLLDDAVEPFLPTYPGEHGAKLTPFFNPGDDEEDCPSPEEFLNAPVFVSKKAPIGTDFDKKEFLYYGQYSQSRFSDSLDYDRMYDVVPYHVKERWAEILTDNGKAPWIHRVLLGHLYPKYQYEGRLPDPKAHPRDYGKDIVDDAKYYLLCLSNYKADDEMRGAHITKENILQAFEEPDCGEEPGIRLFWEYLECVDWDLGFYNMLVSVKEKKEAETAPKNVSNVAPLKPAFRPTAPDFSPRVANEAKHLHQKDVVRACGDEQGEDIKESANCSKLKSKSKLDKPRDKDFIARKLAMEKAAPEVAARASKVVPPHLRAQRIDTSPAAMPHNMDGIYSSIFSARPFFPSTKKGPESEYSRLATPPSRVHSPSLSASPSRRFESPTPFSCPVSAGTTIIDDLLFDPPFEVQFHPAMVPTKPNHFSSTGLWTEKKKLTATAPIFCPSKHLSLSEPQASQGDRGAPVTLPASQPLSTEVNGETETEQSPEPTVDSMSEENGEQSGDSSPTAPTEPTVWRRTEYIPRYLKLLESPIMFPSYPSRCPGEIRETKAEQNIEQNPEGNGKKNGDTKSEPMDRTGLTRTEYNSQHLGFLKAPLALTPNAPTRPEENSKAKVKTNGEQKNSEANKEESLKPDSKATTEWTRTKYTPQHLRSLNNLDSFSSPHGAFRDGPISERFSGEESWKNFVWRRHGDDAGGVTVVVGGHRPNISSARVNSEVKRPVLRAKGRGRERGGGYLPAYGSGGEEGDDERDEGVDEEKNNCAPRLFNPGLAREVREELERQGVPVFAKLRSGRKKKERKG